LNDTLNILWLMLLHQNRLVLLWLIPAGLIAIFLIDATRCLAIAIVNFTVYKKNKKRHNSSNYQTPLTETSNSSAALNEFGILDVMHIPKTISPQKPESTSYYDSQYPKYIQPLGLLIDRHTRIINRLRKVVNHKQTEPIEYIL
jgi:hypothetical protein